MKFFFELQVAGFHDEGGVQLSINKLTYLKHQAVTLIEHDTYRFARVLTNVHEQQEHYLVQFENGSFVSLVGYPISFKGIPTSRFNDLCKESIEQALVNITSEFEGAYCAVAWDNERKQCAFATDPLGIYPLYLSISGTSIMLSSEIKAITCRQKSLAIDVAGLVSWLHCGNTVGEQTLVKGISRPRAGSIYVYDGIEVKQLEHKYYWQRDVAAKAARLDDVAPELISCLNDEVVQMSQPFERTRINLSGGFDSRMIAGLLSQQGKKAHCVSFKHFEEQGDLDSYLAKLTAKKLGFSFELRDANLADSLSNYQIMGELCSPAEELFIGKIFNDSTPSMEAIWDGLLIGYAFKFTSTEFTGFEQFIQSPIGGQIKLSNEFIDEVFAQTVSEEVKHHFHHLDTTLMELYGDGLRGVYNFLYDGKIRRRTGHNAIYVQGNTAYPLIPGVSRRFQDGLGQIDLSLAVGAGLQKYLYSNFFQELNKIPVITGGEFYSLDCHNPLYLMNCHWRKTVLDNWRVKQLMGYLNSSPLPEDIEQGGFFHLLANEQSTGNQARLGRLQRAFQSIFYTD